ncbi:MAG TPA: DCC1-like thiol-disulfide oxidoreductase family protein [Rickettsiales bacterium]|nr:DCC1-like thiol-disulfide oxidoreductase family protein [Rickettsiales bacterium]
MQQEGIWFVYDGDCPICTTAAHALRIREAAGKLHLLNARTQASHPLMQEIHNQKLNLDEGMVIRIGENFYHGADALHIMALLGTNRGWFNRMNALLFRSKTTARLCYPSMRACRNLLLRLKGVHKIRNLENT